MLFLFIVLLLVLTAGVIWALHRNQLRRQVEVVDRTRELPPLESTALPDFMQQRTGLTTDSATAVTSNATAASSAPQKVTPAPKAAASDGVIWQDQVKQLKDAGDLDGALLLCQQYFPRTQAFQQAAVVLRLQIRQHIDKKQPHQALVSKLYRCAVLADLFRSNVQRKPGNPVQAMKELASVEFRYRDIGHQHLKLLTKNDVKLLVQLWGAAERHSHAEQVLGDVWDKLCQP